MDQQKLMQQLKKGQIDPVYFFYGQEKLLMIQALHFIKKVVLPAGLEDFNFAKYDGEKLTGKQIVEYANELPFMAEKKIVFIESLSMAMATQKNGGQSKEEDLMDYLENPNMQCCLIIMCYGKIDKRKKVVKALLEKTVSVEFATLKGIQLEQWIKQYLSHMEKEIEPAALSYLSGTGEYSLEVLEHELDKLFAFASHSPMITVTMVKEIMTKTIDANVFDLIDAIGNRQGKQAITLLQDTVYLGEPPLKIVTLLVRHFRLLIMTKDLRLQGYQQGEIKDMLKLHPFVVTKCLKQATAFEQDQLIANLSKLLLVEVEMKSTTTPPAELLERFVLDVCYNKK